MLLNKLFQLFILKKKRDGKKANGTEASCSAFSHKHCYTVTLKDVCEEIKAEHNMQCLKLNLSNKFRAQMSDL